ncbi:MAG TPA: ATP-binding cassette domain-containing protein [Nitrospiria bacterium]|nr:ATP-binding cassette domain-containing protein [Nitrospiria bacterium]
MPTPALFGLRGEAPQARTAGAFPLGVQIMDVWKSYQPGLPVLREVSLQIGKGDLVVVEGPTGAGKSTLLHLVAGIERPDAGRIAVGTPVRDRRVRVYETLKAFGLESRRNDYPDQLSAGEAQCVGLARALAARPAVVLADEPTALLDRRSASSVLLVLRDIHARGATVLITSHDPDMASRLGGRRVLLRDGRVDEPPAARRGTA